MSIPAWIIFINLAVIAELGALAYYWKKPSKR